MTFISSPLIITLLASQELHPSVAN